MTEAQHTKLSAFVAQSQSVIDWNSMKYAGGIIPFASAEEIENQAGYTTSEAQEVLDGINDRNAREVLDGVCDTFVTATFMVPLARKNRDDVDDHSILLKAARNAQSWADALPTLDRETATSLLESMAKAVIANANDLVSTMKLCYLLDRLGIDVPAAIEAVMKSNWSKYPLESDLKRFADDECRWIEANRNVTDVRHITFAGRLIFRNKMGNGKIMKPSMFADPVFNDHDVALLDRVLFETRTATQEA